MKLFLIALTLSAAVGYTVVPATAWDVPGNSPPTQIEVNVNESDDECFGILTKIDTSPVYGMDAGKKGVTSKGSTSKAKSLVNFMFDTRGSDWSKEGADIAVHGTSDITSDSTRFYRDQMHRDELHWRVITLIAMIANGLGKAQPSDAQSHTVIGYVTELRGLIGDGETDDILKWLTGSDTDRSQSDLRRSETLDLPKVLEAQDAMLEAALNKDIVIASARKELQPYANKTKSRRVATKIAYSTLGMAAFVPNWIAPIAESTFLGTMMANGGPEQDKLLKELYFAKRISKRTELLQRQLNLALDCRAISVATNNGTLYKFAREFTEYMCGETMETALFPGEQMISGRIEEQKSEHQTPLPLKGVDAKETKAEAPARLE